MAHAWENLKESCGNHAFAIAGDHHPLMHNKHELTTCKNDPRFETMQSKIITC